MKNWFEHTLASNRLVLMEAAVIESLRNDPEVVLHPRLENALLIYDDNAAKKIAVLYRGFIGVAMNAGLPILIAAPTWRTNRERLQKENIQSDVNADAVRFMCDIRESFPDYRDYIMVGGLIGCKNDCYLPEEALTVKDAESFHSWQIEKLAAAGVDFIQAATLPSVDEALGIARAAGATGTPYMIGFVINGFGEILDGSTLESAFRRIDEEACPKPFGYMVNCSYPTFLKYGTEPEDLRRRLIGYQANASSLDHSELDGSTEIKMDAIDDWGDEMIRLHREFGVKILGGCCGTTVDHLKYIVNNL